MHTESAPAKLKNPESFTATVVHAVINSRVLFSLQFLLSACLVCACVLK